MSEPGGLSYGRHAVVVCVFLPSSVFALGGAYYEAVIAFLSTACIVTLYEGRLVHTREDQNTGQEIATDGGVDASIQADIELAELIAKIEGIDWSVIPEIDEDEVCNWLARLEHVHGEIGGLGAPTETRADGGICERDDGCSDGELLDAVEEAYTESIVANDQFDRFTALNQFHDLRNEASERGLSGEVDEITTRVRRSLQQDTDGDVR